MNNEVKFAEWLAKNHFVLYNESKEGIFYWKNEDTKGTTSDLYLIFKNER